MTTTPTTPPPHKSRLKQLIITLFKIAIAVLGIGWVIHKTSWNNTATLPAGTTIRTATLLDDTSVTVLHENILPPLINAPAAQPKTTLTVQLPSSLEVNINGQHQTIIPDPNSFLPPVLDLPPSFFKADAGEIIHEGIHAIFLKASSRWYLIALAWLLLFFPFLVTAIRWRALLHPQGIFLPLFKCLQLTFVGQFYSILLPGITGGDLVKIVYTARLTGSKTKSLITVLLDRVIGLIALMVIAAVSAGTQLLLNKNAGLPLDSTLLEVFIFILALLFCLAVGAFIYFSRRLRKLVGIAWFIENFRSTADPEATHHQHDKLEALFRTVNLLILLFSLLLTVAATILRYHTTLAWAQSHATLLLIFIIAMLVIALSALAALILHTRIVDKLMPAIIKSTASIIRIDEVLHTYHGHFGLLLYAFLISIPSQLTLPLSAWLCGLAFGMTSPVTAYLSYVPVAVLAASLPISPPQGFGILDSFLLRFFVGPTASASQAFALAQSIRFLPILWNLFGSYWVVTGTYSRHQTHEEEKALDPEPSLPPPPTQDSSPKTQD